jgi:hypothetical protein
VGETMANSGSLSASGRRESNRFTAELTMKTYILDRLNFSAHRTIKLLAEGKVPLCPVCKSRILVAQTPEEAKAQGIPPGMQCSQDAKHFQVEFLLKRKKEDSV